MIVDSLWRPLHRPNLLDYLVNNHIASRKNLEMVHKEQFFLYAKI
jgi:hypothetical protein